MISNFEKIKKLLEFESEDEFYFLQILQRKKENEVGGTKNHNRLLRYHAITSIEKLDSLEDELKQFANFFNARVTINLNKRSFRKIAFKALNKLSDAISDQDYQRARYAWLTACGKYGIVGEKRWILDIDYEDNEDVEHYYEHELVDYIQNYLKPEENKVISRIPSKNGYHLITKPFDTQNFKTKYPEIEVHKNNPTNLFIP